MNGTSEPTDLGRAFCDLVMKGGITSGGRLSERHRAARGQYVSQHWRRLGRRVRPVPPQPRSTGGRRSRLIRRWLRPALLASGKSSGTAGRRLLEALPPLLPFRPDTPFTAAVLGDHVHAQTGAPGLRGSHSGYWPPPRLSWRTVRRSRPVGFRSHAFGRSFGAGAPVSPGKPPLAARRPHLAPRHRGRHRFTGAIVLAFALCIARSANFARSHARAGVRPLAPYAGTPDRRASRAAREWLYDLFQAIAGKPAERAAHLRRPRRSPSRRRPPARDRSTRG